MKITKFAQSCILIESLKKRILIDPGYLEYDENLLTKDWNDIDAIFITHKHGDHFHPEAVQEILKNSKTKLYSTQEVASTYPDFNFQIVKEGDAVNIGSIKVEVVKAVHGYVPFLKGDKEVSENVGYIVDDGKTRAYQTSDTICFKNDYKCDIVFVPVCNHGLVMSPFEAAQFAKETGAKIVIPFHYDNPKFPVSKEKIEEEFQKQEVNYKLLKIGESIDI